MREIGEIQADLAAARARYASGLADIHRLERELAAAQAATSEAHSHPWVGRAVKKPFNRRSWARGRSEIKQAFQRGTLVVFGPEHAGKRGAFAVKPGKLAVLAGRGGTIYPFVETEGWELDDEQQERD